MVKIIRQPMEVYRFLNALWDNRVNDEECRIIIGAIWDSIMGVDMGKTPGVMENVISTIDYELGRTINKEITIRMIEKNFNILQDALITIYVTKGIDPVKYSIERILNDVIIFKKETK